ncbi:MAG: DUF1800 domain-containing protein [Planctomycetota bacterium]|nr:DUF1800 domain-containing protein [Planctomycetota bacterium]
MLRTCRGLCALLATVALLSTTACGGGGGSGGGVGVEPDVKSFSLAPQTTLTPDDVKHFLNRTQFAVTQSAYDDVMATGLNAYVDQMLVAPLDPTFEQAAIDATIPVDERLEPDEDDVQEWWLYILLNSDAPFREALAMFWHDHFATGIEVLSSSERRWYLDHVNLLRTSGAGDFRQFLFDVAVDNTMLDWLDGFRSRVNNINENWAREFWELFTLGEGNGYTQADIEEAARCFTGFDDMDDPNNQDLRIVEYVPSRHDEGDKMVLETTITGRTGQDGLLEYNDVIDLTLSTRPVAEYIVKKLWEYFVYVDPPQEVIDQLAQVFRDNDYELSPVLAMMFKSEAFFSNRAKDGIIKSPVDYGVGFMRSTGLQSPLRDVRSALGASGQLPSEPPDVSGWEQGALWLSAQTAVERANLINDVITDRDYQANTLQVDVRDLLPPGADPQTPPTVEEIVDGLTGLLDVDLTDDERTQLITYLNTDRENDGTIVDDAFDPANDTHVDERVRGLLYILSQHPSYHVR